ncbi:MAG: response regulator transcription factor [Actinomycetota bacterium]|nr:MAG: response regulator transcription factor [Actinomycetota bacterium]
MTTVLVCDDAPLAREAVRRSVGTVPGVERVTSAGSGEEVLARYPLERPDMVLMDVRMPGIGGIEASRRLVAAHGEANVVMLTMGEDLDGVARAVAGGARGYLAKDASREEVASTVALALSTRRAVGGVRGGTSRPTGAPPALTEREQQVLEGMSRGKSNAQIGAQLYLSEDTVKTHARRLFRKLAAADRAQAVALGFRWGFLR